MWNRVVVGSIVLVLSMIVTPAWAAPPDSMIACDEALNEGKPAVEACERAVGDQPDSAYARASLAAALLDGVRNPPYAVRDRARELAEQALGEAPDEYEVALRVGQVALMLENRHLIDKARSRMAELDPEDYRGQLFASIAALVEGDGWAAWDHYREARSLGAPPEALAEVETMLTQHVPWWVRWLGIGLPILGTFVVTWLVVLLGLIIGGGILSRATLGQTESFAASSSATGQGTPAERRLRKIYRLVLLICSAFYYASLPMVLLAILMVFGIIVLLQLMAGILFFKLTAVVGIIALISMGAVLRSIFVRVRESDPGPAIDTAEHPRLRTLLEQIASRLETRPVDAVYMTPGTDVAVYERGTIVDQLRGKSRRCMILGAGVLGALDVRELSSVLAHEYGHFRNADTSGGAFALATRRSLMTMATHLAQAGAAGWYNPAWLFLLGYHKLFLRISQGASRQQEVLADRWAAQTYGSAAFVRGMRKVIEQDLRFDAHVDATLHEVVETKTPLINLYRFQPSTPIDSEAFEAKVREVLEAEPSPYDSHPRPADRMSWVERLGCPEPEIGPGERESAWSLFEQPEQIEEEMTDIVRERVELQFGVQFAAPARDDSDD